MTAMRWTGRGAHIIASWPRCWPLMAAWGCSFAASHGRDTHARMRTSGGNTCAGRWCSSPGYSLSRLLCLPSCTRISIALVAQRGEHATSSRRQPQDTGNMVRCAATGWRASQRWRCSQERLITLRECGRHTSRQFAACLAGKHTRSRGLSEPRSRDVRSRCDW